MIMGFLIGVLIIVAITVFPVMISAKILNAGNTGFLSCLIAVVISSFGGAFVNSYFSDEAIGLVVSLAITTIIFSMVLGAKYIQSACIALLATALQFGCIFLLATFGTTVASA